MCGIAGFVTLAGSRDRAHGAAIGREMGDRIAHRGPDGSGVWVAPDGRAVFAHRRLAIVDVSPTGAQPMASASGRFVVTFNGEIYNFRELRAELPGPWRGTSDTEVLLALFERYGVVAALPRLAGMFAIAVYDRDARTVILARDRFGEKPLYWGRAGADVVFASELKAVRAHPDFEARIDRGALVQYFRYACVPAPRSIYEGIGKLMPGHHVTIDLSRGAVGSPVAYYDLRAVAARGVAEPLRVSAEEAAERLEHVLRRAIRRQMNADVPLGAFLSGGLDSSTVVALMQAESTRPVRTYTIGFDERAFDESEHAAAVAAHLGTEHTQLIATPDACLALVPELPRIYGEPFADASQMPSILLARMTRGHVTVALTGDAGDELFGGYAGYQLLRKVARLYAVPGRRAVGRAAHAVLARLIARTTPDSRARGPIDWLYRRVRFAAADDLDAYYQAYMSSWHDLETLVPGAREPRGLLPLAPDALHASPTERAMLADSLQYLPDDVLTKVDRASMSVALEARIPLLDPDVVELAWQLPLERKVSGGVSKVVLRDILARHLPRALFDRPKRGFSVPLGMWLRGPLRDWAEALLDERRLREDGFLDPAPIRERWAEHLAGHRDAQASLWVVLMWQAWRDEYA